jgi:hypothetical protein
MSDKITEQLRTLQDAAENSSGEWTQFRSRPAPTVEPVAVKALDDINLMAVAETGFGTWAAKPHNVKWVRLIAGTPIENDLIVNMADAIRATTTALVAERDEARNQRDYYRGRDQAGAEIETELCAALATANARIAGLEKAMHEIAQWSKAYPLSVFKEPDFEKAREGLESVGITLDAVSASAMRHVIEGVGEIARAALTGGEDA